MPRAFPKSLAPVTVRPPGVRVLATKSLRAAAPAPNPAITTGDAQTGMQPRPVSGVGSSPILQQGFTAPPPGTYATYREMRKDPTIALARALAITPIKAAGWAYELADDAPEDWLTLVQDTMEPLRPDFLRDALRGVEYGWAPFEKVWAVKGGRVTYARLKALLPDRSEILVDRDTGAFAGVKNQGTALDPTYAFVYTHDQECDDYYGRSRYENIREKAWAPSNDLLTQTGRYVVKSAGIIPVIRYPEGVGKDASGVERDNFESALAVLRNLGIGHGVAMPLQLASWAADLLERGMDPKQLASWMIEFVEAKGSHGTEFVEMFRYWDALKLRGMLVPERAAIEGTTGTKAEAEAHASIALLTASETAEELTGQINRGLIDPLLVANFGEGARDKVRLVPAPLVNEDLDFLRGIIRDVLTNPANIDLFLTVTDLDAGLDQVRWPKAMETVSVEESDPNLPAVPDAAPVATAGTEAVADTALTGIQITSLKDLVRDVAAKAIPFDAGLGIARVSFPSVGEQELQRIFEAVRNFVPAPAPVAASRFGKARVIGRRKGRTVFAAETERTLREIAASMRKGVA